MYAIRSYYGLPHVGLEVRQDLVSDQAGARHWAGVLANALQDILADPALFSRLAGDD